VFLANFFLLPIASIFYSANEVVECYKAIQTPEDKKFFSNMTGDFRHFDDVKSERETDNYSKTNLFKGILEERYAK